MIRDEDERADNDGFRALALSLMGIAVILGACIIRFNIEVDRERARAQEEILHCRRQNLSSTKSVVDATLPADECRDLEDRYARRFGHSY